MPLSLPPLRRGAAPRCRPDRPRARAALARTSSGRPAAMISPRTSTMMSSACANTASMSCSVNSTPMPRSRAMPAASCMSCGALPRRHAGGRLVHQQQLGRAGQRDGELHALDVAVGELAAGPVGLRRHADALEQRQRLVAIEVAAHRATSARVRRLRLISAICTFSATVMEGTSARPGRCGRRPGARCARGGRPVMSWPSSSDAAAVGRELAADHVEDGGLAGAVRADDAPAARRPPRRTSHRCAATTPPNDLLSPRPAAGSCRALSRRRDRAAPQAAAQVDDAADDAARERQHDGDDGEAQQQPPVDR